MSRQYQITHRENIVGYFYVEAESEEDAIDVFNCQVMNGDIDFSDMELIDHTDEATLLEGTYGKN